MPQRKINAPHPCLTCGAQFQVYPSQLKKGWGKYCSISCGSASQVGERNSYWKGDTVSYEAAHYRILAAKGPPSDQICGCGDVAKEWAYTHDDPEEKMSPKGRPYSLDLNRYVSMCLPCHRGLDCNRKTP